MGVSALELRRRVLMAQPHKERKTGGIVSYNTHVPQVLDVSVPLSPVQAGTGDPYPPGGGKNKFPVTLTTQTKNGTTFTVKSDGVITVSGTPSELTRVTLNGLVFAPETDYKFSMTGSATGIRVFCKKDDGTSSTYPTMSPSLTVIAGNTYKNFILEVGTTFPGTATELKMQLEAGASVTDWTPYSNIRPISGHTGAAVWRTGKNLCFGVLNKAITLAQGGVSVLNSPGTVLLFYCKKGETYTYSGVNNNRNLFAIFDSVPAVGSFTPIAKQNTGLANRTFIADKDGYGAFYVSNSEIDTASAQINPGATASEYAPYSGESFPVTFPAGCVNKWDEQIAKLTNTYYGSANFIPATPLTEYYIVSPVNIYPLYYDADKNEIGHGNWWKKRTFTTPENTRYIKFYIDPAYGATYKNDISINNPASITVYIPHDQAIFGGRYEPGEGRLLIDRLSFSYTDGVNVYQSQSNRFYMLITGAKRVDSSNQSTYAGVMCDRLKPTTWAGLAQDSGNVSCSPVWGAGVAFRDDRITTVDGWKEYLAENQAQFVFELAEPLIIPLTPAEIRALMGENNVFADTGDVDVEFWTN